MEHETDSWGVVATVREPAALVLAFVAHHLALGAAEVHIYLDDPDDPVAGVLEGHARCHVTRCDAGYWAAQGLAQRPEKQTRRQTANANLSFTRTGVAWMAHLDADEFLSVARPLAEDLSAAPDDIGWLSLPCRERVWLEGETSHRLLQGPYRSALPGRSGLVGSVYGPYAKFFRRGLAGHSAGKGLVRTRRGYTLSIHQPRIGPVRERNIPPSEPLPGGAILHFDGVTPRQWAAKLARYATHDPREMRDLLFKERLLQIDYIADRCSGIDDILGFHAALYRLTPKQSKLLHRAGALEDRALDVKTALAAEFPGVAVDLTPAGFDAALALPPK